MKTRLHLLLFVISFLLSHTIVAQQPSEIRKLDSITISSTRIELPFKIALSNEDPEISFEFEPIFSCSSLAAFR